ncbi:MAG: Fic family protein [Zoogloeaceae bacterium]|jgi:cell filamentation protein|nr:Fic family protein [Zoogloeaceae bacterium]
MEPPTKRGNVVGAVVLEQHELFLSLLRIVELERNPVHGSFDAAHLREINRRIFQDASGAARRGIGEYRPPVPEGKDWLKARKLGTVEDLVYVAYARMDEYAIARLDKVLAGANPDGFRGLGISEFVQRFAALYAELDYIHPFSDGNSRTLRTFTKQLAKKAGYDVPWEQFSRDATGRDLLYIARDLSVNRLAMPNIQGERTKDRVASTMEQLAGNKDLAALLRDIVRPSR